MDEISLLREAKEVIDSAHYPNVEGVSIGYKFKKGKRTDELVVQVWVSRKLPRTQLVAKDMVPEMVFIHGHGIKTDVIQSRFESLILVDHGSPVKPGFSCSHPNVSAGTNSFFGQRNDLAHLVSNAHVIADTNRGKIGDPIYYPGVYDGGTEKDTVAYLAATIPIEMIESKCPIANFCVSVLNRLAKLFRSKHRVPSPVREVYNRVDCACGIMADGIEIDRNIYKIGEPIGTQRATLGLKVQKSGRTTEYTEGEVVGIEARIRVSYSQGTAWFDDQIVSDIPSAGGDSGSAVLTYDNRLVGLLFAGGEGFTVMNPIGEVLEALELDLPQDKEVS